MRKIFVTAMAMAAFASAGAAGAADISLKSPIAARPSCAQFSGFYVGGHAGWAYHDTSWVDRDTWVDNFSNDWALETVSTRKDGIGGGLQGGYNWQRGCTVFLELRLTAPGRTSVARKPTARSQLRASC